MYTFAVSAHGFWRRKRSLIACTQIQLRSYGLLSRFSFIQGLFMEHLNENSFKSHIISKKRIARIPLCGLPTWVLTQKTLFDYIYSDSTTFIGDSQQTFLANQGFINGIFKSHMKQKPDFTDTCAVCAVQNRMRLALGEHDGVACFGSILQPGGRGGSLLATWAPIGAPAAGVTRVAIPRKCAHLATHLLASSPQHCIGKILVRNHSLRSKAAPHLRHSLPVPVWGENLRTAGVCPFLQHMGGGLEADTPIYHTTPAHCCTCYK